MRSITAHINVCPHIQRPRLLSAACCDLRNEKQVAMSFVCVNGADTEKPPSFRPKIGNLSLARKASVPSLEDPASNQHAVPPIASHWGERLPNQFTCIPTGPLILFIQWKRSSSTYLTDGPALPGTSLWMLYAACCWRTPAAWTRLAQTGPFLCRWDLPLELSLCFADFFQMGLRPSLF